MSESPAARRRAAAAEDSGAAWSSLDADILGRISCSLDSARDVAALACVSRECRHAARNNAVWGPLLAQRFALYVRGPEQVPLANLYRQLHTAWRRGGPAAAGPGPGEPPGSGPNAGSGAGPSSVPGRASGSCAGGGGGGGAGGLGAVCWEGLYTDGGMDEDDPSFWVGNMFDPSGWAIHCSRASANVHAIAMLRRLCPPDPFEASHRPALIALAADVGWVLFVHRVPRRLQEQLCCATPGPLHGRLRAAMVQSLEHWNTAGLERLLVELVTWWQLLKQMQAATEAATELAEAATAAAAAKADAAAVAAGLAAAEAAAARMLRAAGGFVAAGLTAEPGASAAAEASTGAAALVLRAAASAVMETLRRRALRRALLSQRECKLVLQRLGRHVANLDAFVASPSAQGVQASARAVAQDLLTIAKLVAAQDAKGSKQGAARGEAAAAAALREAEARLGSGDWVAGALAQAADPVGAPAANSIAALWPPWQLGKVNVACSLYSAVHTAATAIAALVGAAPPPHLWQEPSAAGGSGSGGGGDGGAARGFATATIAAADAAVLAAATAQGSLAHLGPGLGAQGLTGPAAALVARPNCIPERYPLPQRLATTVADIVAEKAVAGERALCGLNEELGPGQEAGPADGLGDGVAGAEPGLEVWDRRSGAFLGSDALSSTTAVIDAVTVSRAGEFTCPLACGALLLGSADRNTALAGASAGAGAAATAEDESSQQGPGQGATPAVRGAFRALVRQPYVQALSGMTEAAAVEAAAAAGLLPPVAARGSSAGAGEWIEFRRPTATAAAVAVGDADTASAAAGGAPAGAAAAVAGQVAPEPGTLWPVVWFRFFPHQGLGDEGDQAMALPPVLPVAGGGGAGGDGGGDGAADGSASESGSGSGSEDDDGWFVGDDASQESGEDESSDEGEEDEDEDEEEEEVMDHTELAGLAPEELDGGGGENEGEEGDDDIPGAAAAALSDWEDELEFFYGVEGQTPSVPYGFGEEDHLPWDELEAERRRAAEAKGAGKGSKGGDADGEVAGDAGPSSAGGAGRGAGGGGRGPAGAAKGAGRGKRAARGNAGDDKNGGGGGGAGAGPSSHNAVDDAAGSAADAAGASAADEANGGYGGSGELLQGVPLTTWLRHLTKPNVAGLLLAAASDAAGVQALRHTYQVMQTAVQQELLRLGEDEGGAKRDRKGRRARHVWPRDDMSHDGVRIQVPPPKKAAARAAAAAKPAAAAPSPAAAADATAPPALAELLPPAEYSAHAFEGLDDGAANSQPTSQQPAQPPQPPSGHLVIRLHQAWAGNTALVKLISQENRARAFGDDEDGPLNIDVQYLAMRGVGLQLAPPLKLA
ncbi:hypothetical protein HYH03_009721 [Edaphochlamys debaryana]|uniref:F-box domain-containing protein n=1 Tax=Edaphochlamys debaryana TaxID=47281 RepID=A0A835Y0T2_9CHLO|nr:hypothetical protein HYH03_009721 [Edaphochlamys debaryana]|eukprot:KAG2491991.1 hypothetical protein HYH03_009721 [Edaphochlamys debaryana]